MVQISSVDDFGSAGIAFHRRNVERITGFDRITQGRAIELTVIATANKVGECRLKYTRLNFDIAGETGVDGTHDVCVMAAALRVDADFHVVHARIKPVKLATTVEYG